MLIIGTSQIAALDAARLAMFRRKLHAHLTEVLPDQLATLDESRAMAAIDAAIARSREYQLVAEQDVARFVAVSFAVGDRFPERPDTAWTRAVLDDRSRDPTVSMDLLFARLEPQFPEHARLWDAWRA